MSIEASMPEKQQEQDLVKAFVESVSLKEKKILFCDAGYGFPLEARPRREKMLAVAKQLVNFLIWQKKEQSYLAEVVVVGCDEASQVFIEERMKELLKEDLPDNFKFSPQSVASLQDSVYLSPDAEDVLDPNVSPPDRVIVGLLIDRRVQLNRSKDRATKLELPAVRLPLENFNVDKSEPLNVDCILSAMQLWWQNCEIKGASSECFLHSMEQAFEEHCQRHPNRPLHKAGK